MLPLRLLWATTFALAAAMHSGAVIVDRIAAIVNQKLVKDSDIDRDLRITDFLNGDKLDISQPERKKAAQRLIEQHLIRREVEVGAYPVASVKDAEEFLETVQKQRFGGDAERYRQALQQYGVTDEELRAQLRWQLTVLHFIEQRFRPAVLLSQEDIDQYARAHPNETREAAQEQLTEERVNQAFEQWLEGARKRASIEYREAGLE